MHGGGDMRANSGPGRRGFDTWPQAQGHFNLDTPLLSDGFNKERRKDVAKAMRKLLDPLPRPGEGLPGGGRAPESFMSLKPPALPRNPRTDNSETIRTDERPAFNPPLRPRTAEGGVRIPERPRTADRAAKRLGTVSFPSSLRLRPLTEPPGPDSLWAGHGEALVLSLDLQQSVREAAMSEGAEVTDGMLLTIWAIAAQPDDGSDNLGTCLLEPLVARRPNRSLAVEPVEVVVELQSKGGNASCSSRASARGLRFGEGFRLRLAGVGLYLSHSNEHVHWERLLSETDHPWPRDSRFTAHGGELGTSVRLGRRLSLQRIASPPQSESESEVESSSESESERILRGAPPRRCRAVQAATPSAISGTDGAATDFPGGLISRVADRGAVLPATFLPLGLS